MRLVIGITGASGAIYGVRLLEILREIPEVETHLIMSNYGRYNIQYETEHSPKEVEAMADVVHSESNLAASVSSGSFKTDGMVVAPCSMKTLSAIAHSFTDGLVARAADVTLKERRPLVLMPRETPLHQGHCELIYKVARMGAVIAPPMPACYNHPQSIDDIINHSVGRVIDLFGLDSGYVKRWAGPK